ncbi:MULTISPECIES: PLD nuclease N-terminal domain-containing protein [unclassified Microbacterium]|uniref:PLD nuclease N-terminal domain-containing protein n=1 Tax=unclassified Microbacterium TaxID=2609290 RepID=UPI001ACC5A16|nr:PLD nuclease N-terminal domain-containing protein [Microbacterium sp.]MBN9157577.1 PLDc_N domain-containing protein [Microbacterium sp.]MBS1898421.1 PLDc_N domain-containing protein [Actinomycetota bacterium]MBS1901784.1 PLDc_N domain-containing protein [Actinomycetota bacterium]
MGLVFSILVLVLMVGALIDIITRRDDQVKHLPKVFWIILVIIVPLAGSLIWFLVGREYDGEGIRLPRPRERRPAPPAPSGPSRPADTRSTEQQIADLDREIEEWRLRAEIEKRKKQDGTDAG